MRFHEAYERLAPTFSYKTRRASATPWPQVPSHNKALMIAVCAEILSDPVPLVEGACGISSDLIWRHPAPHAAPPQFPSGKVWFGTIGASHAEPLNSPGKP